MNKIVQHVEFGKPRKGLIWHCQGSGKSLLMLFVVANLRMHPAFKNPSVLMEVDWINLDSHISGTFHAADMPTVVRTSGRI